MPPDNVSAKALDTTAFVYDTGGRLAQTCAYPAGQSCSWTTDTRTSTPTYDQLGRVKSTVLSETGTSSITRTTTYALDGQALTVAEGSDTLTYLYDTLGRLDQFKRSSTVLTDFAYNDDGTVQSRVDGGLASTSFGYDWANRPSTVTLSSSIYSGANLTFAYRLDGLKGSIQRPTRGRFLRGACGRAAPPASLGFPRACSLSAPNLPSPTASMASSEPERSPPGLRPDPRLRRCQAPHEPDPHDWRQPQPGLRPGRERHQRGSQPDRAER